MQASRADHVFGLLERAADSQQRCPTNPEIAADLQNSWEYWCGRNASSFAFTVVTGGK
jgi:hypothetical protein